MRVLQVREQSRILLTPEGPLSEEEVEFLFRLDETRRQEGTEPLFEWHYRHYIRTRSVTGVIQIPGLQLEILPHVEYEEEVFVPQRAQQNFLVMLHLSGLLPFPWQHLANVSTLQLPLLETWMYLFAEGLFREFQRGLPRDFRTEEKPSTYIRGKLQISRQIRESPGRYLPHYTAFSAMVENTPLNQLLKAATRLLLPLCRFQATRQYLRTLLSILEPVADLPPEHLQHLPIHLDRRFQRFAPYVAFAQLVLRQRTPGIRTGEVFTFSLLFPMERVFEQFVAAFLRKHLHHLFPFPPTLEVQSRHPALLDNTKHPATYVQPDIVLEWDEGKRTVLDTKWKHLTPRTPLLPERDDLHQMMAYSLFLQPEETILLYPAHRGLQGQSYRLATFPERKLTLAFLPLAADMMHTFEPLQETLQTLLSLSGEARGDA